MKYIVFENEDAIIFSNRCSHDFIAAGRNVLSAGFCRIETHRNCFDDIRAKVSVWGQSDSLKVKSNPADAQILENFFFD